MTQIPENWKGWTKETPPVEGAFLTERGWEIPLKGTDPAKELTEVIVTFKTIDLDDVTATLQSVVLSYDEATETIQALALFNEPVNVTAGATLKLTADTIGEITLTADAHTEDASVAFTATTTDKGTYSLTAQTITGTIKDSSDDSGAVKVVTADIAGATTPIFIRGIPKIVSAVFESAALTGGDVAKLTLTFSEEVVLTGESVITLDTTGTTPLELTAEDASGLTIEYTGETIDETATYSLVAGVLDGDIVLEDDPEREVELEITSALVASAGDLEVTASA